MVAKNNIKVAEETKKNLNSLKIHPRETYDDLLKRVLKSFKKNLKGGEKK